MAHLIQVGAGSGGIAVIDLVCRDPRVTKLTLIEPDIFKPHNVDRHYFSLLDLGEFKVDLAARWLQNLRPELELDLLRCDLFDQAFADRISEAAAQADLGICAVDNEPAKYHWDALMRRHGKPWTLGEVLSGGIGGFIHRFKPQGPCYGCVASYLKRSIEVEKPSAPDYSQPGGPIAEATVPASKASITAVASLHALVTLGLLDHGDTQAPDFTSLLFTLQKVQEVFAEAFRTYRFQVSRAVDCLICGVQESKPLTTADEIDAALNQALARLGHE